MLSLYLFPLMLEYLTALKKKKKNIQILKFPMYSFLEFICLKTSLHSEDFPSLFRFSQLLFSSKEEKKQNSKCESGRSVDVALSLQRGSQSTDVEMQIFVRPDGQDHRP